MGLTDPHGKDRAGLKLHGQNPFPALVNAAGSSCYVLFLSHYQQGTLLVTASEHFLF